MANSIDAVVRAYARKLGLDARAVLGIATHESGRRRNAVGDHGTSFGPFQLHAGGALPKGKGAAWAGSNAGIYYAMQRMANSGARGKKGLAAISAISRNFERPANPNAEIQHAMQWYKGSNVPVNFAAPGNIPVGAIAGAIGGDPGSGQRQALMKYALAQSQALTQGTPAPNMLDLMQTFQKHETRELPSKQISFGQGGGGGGKAAMLEAIRHAQQMGLRVGENEAVGGVDPVHVKDSYHYKTYKGSHVSEASDISGNAKLMAQYYKWARARYGKNLTELFYDPIGGIKYGKPIGAIGGHKDHVHIAFGG